MSIIDSRITVLRKRLESRLRRLSKSLDAALARRSFTDVAMTAPRWLSVDAEVRVVQWAESERHDVYFGALEEVDSFSVDPPRMFTAVEFELVGTERIEDLSIEAEFTSKDGSKRSRDARYSSGRSDRPKTIPVHFSAGTTAQRVEVSINVGTSPPSLGQRLSGHLQTSNRHVDRGTIPWPTLPSICPTEASPSILFVSIDSLRYDRIADLGPVIDALGEQAVVPAEPRTQGHATQESHGSTFTSLHPGDHGLPHSNGLPTSIPTLPELLLEHGYRCSGSVSTVNLDPWFGFGRGFHRFERQEMSWNDRAHDIRTQVESVRRWMETDGVGDGGSYFYFLHCFDAHYPYVPPTPLTDKIDIDHELADRIIQIASEINSAELRTDLTLEDVGLSADELETVLEYYDTSTRFVADQVARLLRYLDDIGALDEMFVIIAGDHGEEFLNRGTLFHTSLYDENIRPGVVVKPPVDSDLVVPDSADLIDLYPTIADLVGESIPDHCRGTSWYRSPDSRYRLTERVAETEYSVAVETAGQKGIFTWNVDAPSRPDAAQHESINREEYYVLEAVRAGEDADVDSTTKDELRAAALEFQGAESTITETVDRDVPDDVVERLEELGYR